MRLLNVQTSEIVTFLRTNNAKEIKVFHLHVSCNMKKPAWVSPISFYDADIGYRVSDSGYIYIKEIAMWY